MQHILSLVFFYFRYSDLLVSAPYHRHDIFGDEGRVYVYINNGAVSPESAKY